MLSDACDLYMYVYRRLTTIRCDDDYNPAFCPIPIFLSLLIRITVVIPPPSLYFRGYLNIVKTQEQYTVKLIKIL